MAPMPSTVPMMIACVGMVGKPPAVVFSTSLQLDGIFPLLTSSHACRGAPYLPFVSFVLPSYAHGTSTAHTQLSADAAPAPIRCAGNKKTRCFQRV